MGSQCIGHEAMSITLSPSQQQAYSQILQYQSLSPILILGGNSGSGKTLVIQALHQNLGGTLVTLQPLVERMADRHPLGLEEMVYEVILEALQNHDVVLIDDFHLIAGVLLHSHSYPRSGWFNAALSTIAAYVMESRKTLIVVDPNHACHTLCRQALTLSIPDCQASDYQHLCQHYLEPDKAAHLDYAKIFRFSHHLTAYQLRSACLLLNQQPGELTTDGFIDYLRSRSLASNVDLAEVQPVDISELKGVDHILQSLEANLIIPLERDDLAIELDLKPKRGILLAGPPGTGKTTIGRALAHRLKSKFFLIDGTFIAGTGDFYNAVHQVFNAAKDNAPSIIFIDDSDVIFESGQELGLYRYLLTMLDGLESESVGQVCVMMTAMNIGSLPAALVRSGRIELWLETGLPDADARSAILQNRLHALPDSLAAVDLAAIVQATETFTGADLKRLVEDAKTLYAYDRAKELAIRSATDYFLQAVHDVQANKDRYAAAIAQAPAAPAKEWNEEMRLAMMVAQQVAQFDERA